MQIVDFAHDQICVPSNIYDQQSQKSVGKDIAIGKPVQNSITVQGRRLVGVVVDWWTIPLSLNWLGLKPQGLALEKFVFHG